MAVVHCADCLLVYDDTYRLTWCPHDGFDLVTTVVRGDGVRMVCASMAQMQDFLDERN
jgi:uncharacterized protein (UPF0276 family)